jgi:hypothetical protein
VNSVRSSIRPGGHGGRAATGFYWKELSHRRCRARCTSGAGGEYRLDGRVRGRSTGYPQGEALKRQFTDLLARIDNAPDLDEDDRALAKEKTEAVADGLANAQREPGRLRRALRDAKGFLTSSAHWVWDGLNQILTSEAAQKTIGTITEAGTKAAIQSFLGIP